MARLCCVFQPFDEGGPYDKRYADVIELAIRAADLDPYRVDRDPGASIPIDKLEEQIRTAAACVADISAQNPNVWYELGYAWALRLPLVMICQKGVKPAFDIQHRNIVFYSSDSPSDFEKLRSNITARLQAELRTKEKAAELADDISPSLIARTDGLSTHEFSALALIFELRTGKRDPVSYWQLKNNMENANINALGVKLAAARLERLSLVEIIDARDPDTGEPFDGILVTEQGEQWLVDHMELFDLTARKS
jgi:hypothetical protein